MEMKSLNKFIIFIFAYILIVFPLALFTEEELFPFSRFPMYAQNSLNPCGYRIHVYKNNQPVALDSNRISNVFLKYSWDTIAKHRSSNAEMCQIIREVFWPRNVSQDDFSVKRYCTSIRNLPSLKFTETNMLICQ